MTMNRYLTDDQLARRLAAYADARLSPSPQASARMRARVMHAAGSTPARTAALAAADRNQPTNLSAYRASFGGRSRALAALMAAALSVLLLGGVAFASSAGGPLYGIRLWVETVVLPSEPAARADADVDRLDARLDEAVGAAHNGNGSATAAALAAYREILEDALNAASKPESRSLRLEAALTRHQLVLSTLLGYVPEPARDALEQAIEKSDQAVKGIGAGPGGSGGGGSGGGSGGGGGNGGGAGNGNDHPVAHPTPKPPHAPVPTPKHRPGRPPAPSPAGKSSN